MTFVDVVLFLLKKEQKTPYRKMENQTYTIGQTFNPGKNNRNQYLTSVKITDIRNSKYLGTEYKMTWYSKYQMNDGSYKKSQRSTWFSGKSSIGMYLEEGWIALYLSH